MQDYTHGEKHINTDEDRLRLWEWYLEREYRYDQIRSDKLIRRAHLRGSLTKNARNSMKGLH